MKILIQSIDPSQDYEIPPIPIQVEVGIWLHKDTSPKFMARNKKTGEKSGWLREELLIGSNKQHSAVSMQYPNIRIVAT